ncbi:SgcJ/EcaC family oxidoreductase [Nocardiopsis tropica]|uniref:SgcJ/EcaC family oxidoreductase n=1 Tax=Nocardiopsis tropica TaxID=109330 RepID=UPI002E82CFE6|nr:SgcJ/EcaC family oxidoreductase [Nocardiopsis tropica]
MDTTSTTLPDRATDERRIHDLVARADRAQNDPVALPALHTSDVVIVNFGGRRLFGLEAFTSAMAEALATPLKDVRTALRVDDIRFVARDVAHVSLTKTVFDGRPEAESSAPREGVMSYLLVREGDDWRISLAQTTPVV